MSLTEEKCVPCEGGGSPLGPDEISEYRWKLDDRWEVIDDRKIKREFKFKDFRETMAFVNRIAEIANAEDHHPDLRISYDRLTVELVTHAIGGLSKNDFIVASKIDRL